MIILYILIINKEKDERIRNIARMMLDGGTKVSDIMQATGLSQEEIDSLKK